MEHMGFEAEGPRRVARTERAIAAQPCPERPWLFGILIGFPLFMTGGVLMLTLIGWPVGILLFAAGLGLMQSNKPCSP